MGPNLRLLVALALFTWLQAAAEASDQQIVYIRNTCECWNTDLKCVCKIESDPTSVRPLMQRLVNRTAEYYWQEVEFQSMVYDRTTFILANTFADGPFPSGITFRGDFSIVNDSFNHLNMTLNKVELNFETFSGRKPKFSKQYWRYIFDHGEATLRTLRIIKYQIEDFIIPNYLGAALTQEVRPLTEFKVVGCEVKEVKERAFKNFTQLEVLDLSDNHLTTLPENVFSRNINLQKILLANNQISFLTKTIFDGLPNLLLINLRKNKLTAVPAIPRHTNRRFQPMVYLMADNSIHCRCSLIWVLHELTFHHNLEIEATCSDPTMVRGMPIIEGFTRMDKEACYRTVRADDGPANVAAPSAAAAPDARRLQAPIERRNPNQIGSSAGQTEAANAANAASAASAASAAAAATADANAAQQQQPTAGGQLAGKSGEPSLSSLPLSSTSLDGGLAVAPAPESAAYSANHKSGPVAAAALLAPPVESQASSSVSHHQSHGADSFVESTAAVAPAPIPGKQSGGDSAGERPLATLISHPFGAQSSGAPIAPIAPQARDSSPDITQPAPAAAAALASVQKAAPSQPQLVNVAAQTILAPSQSVVVAPVAALAPPADAVAGVDAASGLADSIRPQQPEGSLAIAGSKPAADQ